MVARVAPAGAHFYLQKAAKYHDKAAAATDARPKAALDAVAREYEKRALDEVSGPGKSNANEASAHLRRPR